MKAGGTNSYLNNHTYFWTSNGSEDGKVWYVFDKGGFNNLSSSGDNYYSYGVRPVITINGKTALKSGTGTVDDPYMIETLNYKKLKIKYFRTICNLCRFIMENCRCRSRQSKSSLRRYIEK